MTRLNQVIALEAGARSQAAAAYARALAELANPAINGHTRTFAARAEVEGSADDTRPAEWQRVQVDGEQVLAGLQAALARMFDVVLTKDVSNLNAVADVVVDNEVLLPNVPTSYLLFLEAQLGELRKVIRALPVLDPKEDWHDDPVRGLHSATPRVTAAKEPRPQVQVLYPATPEHPAQVRPYEIQEAVGDWTVTKLSGGFEADRVAELLRRLTKLKDAVLVAREEANSMAATDRPGDGARVAEYLLGPARDEG